MSTSPQRSLVALALTLFTVAGGAGALTHDTLRGYSLPEQIATFASSARELPAAPEKAAAAVAAAPKTEAAPVAAPSGVDPSVHATVVTARKELLHLEAKKTEVLGIVHVNREKSKEAAHAASVLNHQAVTAAAAAQATAEAVAEAEKKAAEAATAAAPVQETKKEIEKQVDAAAAAVTSEPLPDLNELIANKESRGSSENNNELRKATQSLQSALAEEKPLLDQAAEAAKAVESAKKAHAEAVAAAAKLKAAAEKKAAEAAKAAEAVTTAEAAVAAVEGEKSTRVQVLQEAGNGKRLKERLLLLTATPDKLQGAELITPVEKPRMTSLYGMRLHPIHRVQKLHAGDDYGAATGTPALSAGNGTVIIAEVMGAFGNVVVVDHGKGVSTLYAHLDEITSSIGQEVAAGEEVGKIGNTGGSTGSHLHFEVRVNGEPISPEKTRPEAHEGHAH